MRQYTVNIVGITLIECSLKRKLRHVEQVDLVFGTKEEMKLCFFYILYYIGMRDMFLLLCLYLFAKKNPKNTTPKKPQILYKYLLITLSCYMILYI
jgi:hypothetical protein